MKRLLVPVLVGVFLNAWAAPLLPEISTPPNRVDTTVGIPSPTPPSGYQSSGWNFIGDAWSWSGSTLSTLCQVVSGQEYDLNQILNLGFPVKIPMSVRYTPELSWICEASQLWKYINDLVGQDWAQFAGDLGGRWIGDVVTGILTQVGIEAGSARWANDIAAFRENLKKSYTDFVKTLRNYVWNGIQADLNSMRARKYGTPPPPNDGSANNFFQSILDFFERLVPTIPAAGIDRAGKIQNAAKQAEDAGKAQKTAEQTEKNVKNATAPLLKMQGEFNSTKNPDGSVTPGLYDTLMNKAKTAASTREVLEVLVEAVLTTARAELYGSTAIQQNLQALTTGQALNNMLLVNRMQRVGADAADAETIIRSELEDQAMDTTALQYATKMGGDAATAIMDALGNTPDLTTLDMSF